MAMRRSRGESSLTTIRISPEVGVSSPAIMRRSVVFPDPEGPRKTRNSPSRVSRFTLLTAPSSPSLNTLVRLRVSTTAIGPPSGYFHLAKMRLYSSSAALAAFSGVSSPRATLANIVGMTNLFASERRLMLVHRELSVGAFNHPSTFPKCPR